MDFKQYNKITLCVAMDLIYYPQTQILCISKHTMSCLYAWRWYRIYLFEKEELEREKEREQTVIAKVRGVKGSPVQSYLVSVEIVICCVKFTVFLCKTMFSQQEEQ